MVIIKIIKPTKAEVSRRLGKKIRRFFDEAEEKLYFSIVDVIGILTHSTDARNYWKVLKNRLKKASPQLVTKFNQLKMLAKDGKYYLTDAADEETMIEIIKSMPSEHLETFRQIMEEE